ncbi:MAG: PilW family protein [Vibrio hibernica]
MVQFPQIKQAGFTLIELIITIVVMAIMIMGIAGFVELGTKGYADTVDRQQLQNQARFVVEKLTREIRHAVPNSFKKTDKCISFYPIDYAGAYVVLPVSGGDPFRFVVVSSEPNPDDLNGLKLVVNPNAPDDLNPTSSKSIPLSGVVKLQSDAGKVTPIYSTDTEPDFDVGSVTNSVGNRLYIYSNKVEYCLVGSSLQRNGVTVGESLTDRSSFASGDTNDPSSDSLARSGLVHIRLYFKQNDEVTNYDSDIQVLNVP